MKPVYQTKFGMPGGDCFRACVASLLELPLDAVPDFMNITEEADWTVALSVWLEAYTPYTPLFISADADGHLTPFTPATYWLCCGKNNQGHLHAAVYRGSDLCHDPLGMHNTGIVTPMVAILFVAFNPILPKEYHQ